MFGAELDPTAPDDGAESTPRVSGTELNPGVHLSVPM